MHPLQELLQQLLQQPRCRAWLEELKESDPGAHRRMLAPLATPIDPLEPHGRAQGHIRVSEPHEASHEDMEVRRLARQAMQLAGSKVPSTKSLQIIPPDPANALLAAAGELKMIDLPWPTCQAELEILDTLESCLMPLGMPFALEFAKWSLEAGKQAPASMMQRPKLQRSRPVRLEHRLAQDLLWPLIPLHPWFPEGEREEEHFAHADLRELGHGQQPRLDSQMEGWIGRSGQGSIASDEGWRIVTCSTWHSWPKLRGDWRDGDWSSGEEVGFIGSWHTDHAKEADAPFMWLGKADGSRP